MKCKFMNFIKSQLQYNDFLNVSKVDEIVADYFKQAQLHFHLLLEMRLLPTVQIICFLCFRLYSLLGYILLFAYLLHVYLKQCHQKKQAE